MRDSVSETDWGMQLHEGFVAMLESGLFCKVLLNFRWTKLSEAMAKLLTKESKCLDLISQLEVFDCVGRAESLILNANWKQLSVLTFSHKSTIPAKKQENQLVDFTKIVNLEVFEMGENIRFEFPRNKEHYFQFERIETCKT
ncbi:predicted protein [Naegleria gruberi]|uniref:Predicted protein n=1 Tax=Naegleria gruberi TaxID=5762 RepID=D2W1P0_NAEGR|nr:uncharacterized protein NAEGRDRAFT_75323 [Naegleria gruberi]EFC36955.1 predicted protein [Naegleria gruberi]|eukprot:XP_002669699.1 predicted protein [Naegleria gruberi strain NEG-M]